MFRFSDLSLIESNLIRYFLFQCMIAVLCFQSCAPKAFLINQPKLVSLYFDKKIVKLEKNDDSSLRIQRKTMRTKIEYGFGIIMEEADRIIDIDYNKGIKKYKKAYDLFQDSKLKGISILAEKHPDFEQWLRGELDIDFSKDDVNDLYWLAAAYGGAISSSRANPHELVHLPRVGRLLNKCINLEPNWNSGALYSAKMSFITTKSDLSPQMLRDSLDYYFNKAIDLSNGMDAGPYLSYAESVHKLFQEKNKFINKLNHVIDMDNISGGDYELTNLIAKRRAKWLLSNIDNYFIE